MRAAVVTTDSAEATLALGARLGPLLSAGDVVLLSGDLGAGKTQLTKGIAEGLGVGEPVTSPTFNILLVHEGRLPLYHFDLYRLERADELEDLDYFGTLEADGASVVEWGDRFADARPDDAIEVTLLIAGDAARKIELNARGPRSEALLGEWVAATVGAPGTAAVSRDE